MEPVRHGHHSADGAWWWSGAAWLPAWTDDRQWWFNGSSWTRASRAGACRPTAAEWSMAVGWLLLWVAALVWCLSVFSHQNPVTRLSTGLLVSGRALAGCALVLLVVCGYLCARAQRWTYVCALVVYVWMLLLATYVVAMLSVPTETGVSGDNDTAAGAGVVILGPPALLLVAALVGIGAGAQALVQSVPRRDHTRSTLGQ